MTSATDRELKVVWRKQDHNLWINTALLPQDEWVNIQIKNEKVYINGREEKDSRVVE